MRILKSENLALIAAVLGVIIGMTLPGFATNISLLGDIFVTLLKLIIVPLIFVSIFLAVARQRDLDRLSGLGLKTIIYFTATSALACSLGMIVARILPKANKSLIAFEVYKETSMKEVVFSDMIMGFFSPNLFKSMSDGNIIHIVVVALFMGMAFLQLSESRKDHLIETFESLHDIVMVLIKWILMIAPIGIFALVASVTAKIDHSLFTGLGSLFVAIALGLVLHVFVSLSAIGFFVGRFNPYSFIFRVKEILIIALATASSNATLPVSTRVMVEKEKVDPRTSDFILPLGATVNMDGSSLYQTLIILYLGNLAGIDFTLSNQVYIFFLILISSVGTAGIPGGGLLMIGAVMQNVGIPLEYLGVYLLIDRVWDPPVTMVNVIGDLFGTKVIDRFQRKTH